MENIKRVVIRQPVTEENIRKAKKFIYMLKMDIDLTAEQDRRGLLTPEKLAKKNQIWKATYEQIANLCGFDSIDDMKYFVTNFINL